MADVTATNGLDEETAASVSPSSAPVSSQVKDSGPAPPDNLSTTPLPDSCDPSSSSVPLSKNALKRLRKEEHRKSLKLARKALDKEKKADKKRKRLEAIAAGEEVEPLRKRAKPQPETQVRFGARIVVDLGFDEKMNEKEVQSLCNQLSYSYGANRKASHTFGELIFTSLDGQTERRLNEDLRGMHKRWKGVEWWEQGYEQLWQPVEKEGEEGSVSPRAPKETVVYLTADGEEELTELKESETYIIGGLVDHNRYKNICRDKALSQGIRAARLPIGKYLAELATRKVLTVNQVFDILLTWVETRDWREAFWRQVPKRKFQGRERGDAESGGGEGERTEEAGDEVEGEEDVGEGESVTAEEDDKQAQLTGDGEVDKETIDGEKISAENRTEVDAP